jgi:hypothetical protein
MGPSVAISVPATAIAAPGRKAQARRVQRWIPIVGAIIVAPFAVVALRLAYCLLALGYCILTHPERQSSSLQQQPWFRSLEPVDNATWPVPKILHQTFKSLDVPQHWQHARSTCLDRHHDWR